MAAFPNRFVLSVMVGFQPRRGFCRRSVDFLFRDTYLVENEGDSRHEEEAVFEVGPSHPSIPSAVKLRHVETGKWLIMDHDLVINSGGGSWESYFRLNANGIGGGTLSVINNPRTAGGGDSLVMQGGSYFSHSTAVPNTTLVAMFTIHGYEAPVSKIWRGFEFDIDSHTIEQPEVFTSSAHRFDNSAFDQTVVIRPSISFSESMDTNWARTQGQAFSESMSVSVSASIPFVDISAEVGFTSERSFSTEEGGGFQITSENSVQVEVPVPPFRKVEVLVVGMRGKVTVPFRFVEITTFPDGTRRERILHDGISTNVSSINSAWTARFYDLDDTLIDTGTQYSGVLPSTILLKTPIA